MLEKILIEPWPFWVAGPLVGLYALAYFYFMNRPFGASSTYQAVLEAAQGKGDPENLDFTGAGIKTDLPVDPRDPAPRWRVWWLAGLFFGGLLAWILGGEGTGTTLLPGIAEFFSRLSASEIGILLFLGGILVGVGTRMSGGCTSGHAINGISQLQLPSLVATCVFFGVGVGFTFLMRWLVQP